MSHKVRGRIAVGTLVTVSMGLLGFFGYCALWVITNFQTVYADNATTNSQVAGVIQHDADIDTNIQEINSNIANLQSQNAQILEAVKSH